jgi:Flp pilus assembly protein TadD
VLLNNLAAAYLKRGDYAHARDAAEKGLALAQELPQLRRNLSAALEALSHADRSVAQSTSRS